MTTSHLLHPLPGALLQSAQARATSADAGQSTAHPLRSLLGPLLATGALTAIAAAGLQLSLLGMVHNFGALWLENWLVAWALGFPIVYAAAPAAARVARFVSATQAAPHGKAGLAFADIATVSARATNRHGFTVLRNLKVREDFYHA